MKHKKYLFCKVAAVAACVCAGCREVVELPPGTTFVTETKIVGAEASGKLFRGAADGSTRLSGGIAVTGWTEREGGFWGAKAPIGPDGKPVYAESLFVNGRRAQRSRFPADGDSFFAVTSVTQRVVKGRTTVKRVELLVDQKAMQKHCMFALPPPQTPFVHLMVRTPSGTLRAPIVSYNSSKICVNGWSLENEDCWTTNACYAFENIRYAFRQAGQWFYDGLANEILYRPLYGETIREAIIPTPALETLLTVRGAQDVEFENVTFSHTAPTAAKGPSSVSPHDLAAAKAAVIVEGSTNVVFRDCRFEDLGGKGVLYRDGCTGGGEVATPAPAPEATYEVPEAWSIKPLLGRTLYSSFRPEGWARTWENVPDLPLFRNVFMTFDFSRFPISTIIPDKNEFLRFRTEKERWQKMPAKFDDVMDSFNGYMKAAMPAFWKQRPDMPFTLYLGGDGREPFRLDKVYGPDVEDIPSYLAWKAKYPTFVGFSFLDEFDSDMMSYVSRYSKIKDPKVRELVHAAFPVTRDPGREADWADEAMRRTVARHFGEKMQTGLYSCVLSTGHNLMRNGCAPVWYEAELGYTSSPWRWGGMFVRGAGRQFQKPWGWYCATLLDGWRTRDGKPPARREISFIEWPSPFWPKAVKYKGCSRSLLARNIMYGYFIGATMIKLEKSWEYICAYGPDGKTPVLSPYGEDFNRPFQMEFDEGFQRGVVYTPVALLVSHREPQRRDNYIGGNRDLFAMPAFLMTLVPTHSGNPGGFRDPQTGEQGCLWNSEFGEFCDVLCPDVPEQDDAAFLEVLKNYKQAFLVGYFEKSRLRIKALEEFVRRGGVLYAEKKQVARELVPTLPKDAKGRIVIVDKYLPDYYDNAPDSWFPKKMSMLSSGTIPCPVIHDLLKKAQDETMPVTVEGDCQWGVNFVGSHWLVWLMNNRGVTKYYLEPEVFDPKATSHVKVTFKPTGKTYEVDVPAGQWTTIAIE